MSLNLNLNWLRSFEAAARLLSFTAASQEIGLTQTAVSLHIKALETQLGDRLFIRRPKSLVLTDVGAAYLISVRDALDRIEMSTNGLFGPKQTVTITLRASLAFIVWLSPRLGAFQAAHPDVGVKLITSIWKGPADQQPVDIDVVLAPETHMRSDLEKLSDECLVPICSPELAKSIKMPEDLLDHPAIHILGYDDHWARYLTGFGIGAKPLVAGLMSDTSVAAMEMIAADLGCAVVIERFAKQMIKTGRNIAIVGGAIPLAQSHYMQRVERPAKGQAGVDAFREWLRMQF